MKGARTATKPPTDRPGEPHVHATLPSLAGRLCAFLTLFLTLLMLLGLPRWLAAQEVTTAQAAKPAQEAAGTPDSCLELRLLITGFIEADRQAPLYQYGYALSSSCRRSIQEGREAVLIDALKNVSHLEGLPAQATSEDHQRRLRRRFHARHLLCTLRAPGAGWEMFDGAAHPRYGISECVIALAESTDSVGEAAFQRFMAVHWFAGDYPKNTVNPLLLEALGSSSLSPEGRRRLQIAAARLLPKATEWEIRKRDQLFRVLCESPTLNTPAEVTTACVSQLPHAGTTARRRARRQRGGTLARRLAIPVVGTVAYVGATYAFADQPAGRVLATGGGIVGGSIAGMLLGGAMGHSQDSGDTGLGGAYTLIGGALGGLAGGIAGGIVTARATGAPGASRVIAAGIGGTLFLGFTIVIQVRRDE